MRKICSLDFLNKDTFNIDVYNENGVILYREGTPVTPDIILRAYFKSIFIRDEDERKFLEIDDFEKTPKIIDVPESTEKEKSATVAEVLSTVSDEPKNTPKMVEQTPKIIQEEPAITERKLLEFNEQIAAASADLSVKFGKFIELSDEELNELKTAAYYKDIGITEFTTADIAEPNFKNNVGIASYNIMKDKMHLSEKVAETAKYYFKTYDVKNFKLETENMVPYYYIVGIVDFYIRGLAHANKERVLTKMLKLGSNRFNIYLLHKFIYMMRENNG